MENVHVSVGGKPIQATDRNSGLIGARISTAGQDHTCRCVIGPFDPNVTQRAGSDRFKNSQEICFQSTRIA